MAPLAPGSLVVVLGITGYIASHIGLQALKAGYRVRGTVRSLSKAEELRSAYAAHGVDVSPNELSFVVLDHLLSESKLETAFAGADGVIDPALPHFPLTELVDKIVEATDVVLRAALKAGVTRLILTGSLMSVLTAGDPMIPTDRLITEDDWNDATVHAYLTADENEKESHYFIMAAYAAAKTLAERAAWNFMKTQSPPFDPTVVLPAMNWGPKLYGEPAISLSWLASIMRGETFAMSMPPHYLVDVRDTAKLHVVSLSNAETTGTRILAAAHPVGWNHVLVVLRKHFPEASVPADRPLSPIDPWPFRIDSSSGKALLDGEWIDFEQCLVDSARSLGF